MKAARKAQREAAKNVENPIEPGETLDTTGFDRRLHNIHAEEATQQRFYTYLEKLDPTLTLSIKQKLASGELLSDDERRFQDQGAKSFNIQEASAEKAAEFLTDDEVLVLAESIPDLGALFAQIAEPADACDVIRSHVKETSIKDPAVFKQMTDMLRRVRTLEKSVDTKNAEQLVVATIKKFNITDEKYDEAIQKSLDLSGKNIHADTNKAFQRFASEQMRFYEKWSDKLWFRKGSTLEKRTEELRNAFRADREVFQKREQHMNSLGLVLKATLDPQKLKSIQDAMVTGSPIRIEKERGMGNIKDFRTIWEGKKVEFGSDARKERLIEYAAKEAAKLDKRADQLNDTEKNAIKDGWTTAEDGIQQTERKKHRAVSIFTAILEFLFPSKAALRSEADTLWK